MIARHAHVLGAARGTAVALADITVITATMPNRAAMLKQAIESVASQTLKPLEHLVSVDIHRIGGHAIKNRLIESAKTEWIAILDDDDILKPNHLQALFDNSAGADIISSYADGPGYSGWYNRSFDPESLKHGCTVGHNALIRRSLFTRAGMFGPEHGYDWVFWAKALAAGAVFKVIPSVTWTYRIDDNWEHESKNTEGLEETRRIVRSILG
jgi:glycosyltransferase involved in cell wall biosynthesis